MTYPKVHRQILILNHPSEAMRYFNVKMKKMSTVEIFMFHKRCVCLSIILLVSYILDIPLNPQNGLAPQSDLQNTL